MSEAATNPRPKNSTLIRRFLPYMAKYRGVLAFDLFCAALTTLCDIALPSIMRTLTNTVSAAALTVDTVLRLAALYFVLRIIDGAASYFMSGIGHIMGVHIETDMRRDAFDHLLRLDHTYYNNTKVGQIMGRITNDLFDVTEFAHHCPEEFFIAGIKIAASFVILCQASVPLTLVVFACVPLMGVVSVKLNRKLRERFRQQRFQIGELNATIEDSLLGQRVVKAFAAEEMEREKFAQGNRDFEQIKTLSYHAMAAFNTSTRLFDGLMYFVVILAGGLVPCVRGHQRGRPCRVCAVCLDADRDHPPYRRICRAVPARHDRHRALCRDHGYARHHRRCPRREAAGREGRQHRL